MSALIRRVAKGSWRGVLVVAVLVAGCSLYSQPVSDWERPSGSEDQTAADLSACRAQASAVVERDAAIDQDIASARAPTTTSTDQPDVFANMNAFEQQNRYNRIVNDCMRQRGYVLPQKTGS
ncbi:MAG: hypothetical protein ACREEE_03705 [Dongiaceae bacterium]